MAYLVTYQIFKAELRLCSFSIREIYMFYYEKQIVIYE